jgi:flagellar hook protein FlgE
MLRSLYSGVTGLNQNILRLDVIGNNIANANTVGFKSSRVVFSDAFSQTLRGATGPLANRGGVNPIQVGNGVNVDSIGNSFSQGRIQATGGALDVAIQGEGLFVVDNGERLFFTRAGTFSVDGDGRIVHGGTGYFVQGYAYDTQTESYADTLGELRVPFNQIEPARATETLDIQGNLPLDSEAMGTILRSGRFEDALGSPAAAATLLTDLRSPGSTDQMLFAGDQITIDATVGGTDVSAAMAVGAGTTVADLLSFVESTLSLPAGSASITAEGTVLVEGDADLGLGGEISRLDLRADDGAGLERTIFNGVSLFAEEQAARDALSVVKDITVFDSLGAEHVLTVTFTRETGELAWTWVAEVDGGLAPVIGGGSGRATFASDGTLASLTFDDGSGAISFDPGNGATAPQAITLGLGSFGDTAGTTIFAGPETLVAAQDGYSAGDFVDFSIDGAGTIFALFSNGVTTRVGDLALALFNNPTALTKAGGNLYENSSNSGDPVIRRCANVAGTSIVGGALEQSNVDLASEFSDMIVTQRAFQASARVVQTASEILGEMITITR